MRTNLVRLLAFGLVATSATAGAQWDPESGDTGQWQPPPEEQPQQQQPQQQPPAQTQVQAETPWGGQQQPPPQQQPNAAWGQQTEERPPVAQTEPAGDTDHAKVSFGVSFFGVERFQITPFALTTGEDEAYSLPVTTIGVRLWVTEMIGLDVGLGLGIETSSYDDESTPGGDFLQGERDGAFALRLQVGLPVALKTYQHFNILLIPEVAFTYGATTYLDSDPDNDINVSAVALDLGVKVGGELQFGFWGVPNLSLQATVGLGFRYASRSLADAGQRPFDEGGIGQTYSGISLQTFGQQLGSMLRINYYF